MPVSRSWPAGPADAAAQQTAAADLDRDQTSAPITRSLVPSPPLRCNVVTTITDQHRDRRPRTAHRSRAPTNPASGHQTTPALTRKLAGPPSGQECARRHVSALQRLSVRHERAAFVPPLGERALMTVHSRRRGGVRDCRCSVLEWLHDGDGDRSLGRRGRDRPRRRRRVSSGWSRTPSCRIARPGGASCGSPGSGRSATSSPTSSTPRTGRTPTCATWRRPSAARARRWSRRAASRRSRPRSAWAPAPRCSCSATPSTSTTGCPACGR